MFSETSLPQYGDIHKLRSKLNESGKTSNRPQQLCLYHGRVHPLDPVSYGTDTGFVSKFYGQYIEQGIKYVS